MTTRMPRELAASPRSRRPRKGSASPADAAHGPAWREQAPPAAVQDEALSEIRHEVGNLFHRVYHWVDLLRAQHQGAGGDATAGQMLEQGVRNLEEFLGIALDYFRPLTLEPLSMTAGDIIAGVRTRVDDAGGSVVLGDAVSGWERRALLIDPMRLPGVLDVSVRRLLAQAPEGTPARAAVCASCCAGPAGVTVELALDGDAARAPAFHTAAGELAWAVARRVVALHGGELKEHGIADGGRRVVLFLPYHA